MIFFTHLLHKARSFLKKAALLIFCLDVQHGVLVS